MSLRFQRGESLGSSRKNTWCECSAGRWRTRERQGGLREGKKKKKTPNQESKKKKKKTKEQKPAHHLGLSLFPHAYLLENFATLRTLPWAGEGLVPDPAKMWVYLNCGLCLRSGEGVSCGSERLFLPQPCSVLNRPT